jgi:hypothetical protein
MLLLDSKPDRELGEWAPTTQQPFRAIGRRWTPEDGSPVLVQMDDDNGLRALEKSPERYSKA